jgi:hypothetical protein
MGYFGSRQTRTTPSEPPETAMVPSSEKAAH